MKFIDKKKLPLASAKGNFFLKSIFFVFEFGHEHIIPNL